MIGLLTRFKPPLPNILPSERRALRDLRANSTLMILPADKGKATVVLDKQDYGNRMENMLLDRSTYQVLSKDPTPSLQRSMNAKLLQLSKCGVLPTTTYNKLRCTSGSIPSIYGLPNIHKLNVPLRPIVSFCTSPTYNLSKYLVGILSPLVGHSPSAVKNSKEFVQFTQTIRLEEEVLVSFDVVSLFTKIAIPLALEVARRRLENDVSLDERTPLSVDDIMSLLSLCLNVTYFVFRGVFYKRLAL